MLIRRRHSFEEVADSSKAITEQVNGIAEALETQTNAINEVNKGVEQINDVVQTNSASSQECHGSKPADEQPKQKILRNLYVI